MKYDSSGLLTRDRQVSIRFKENEFRQIEAAAAFAQCTVSVYIRSAALTHAFEDSKKARVAVLEARADAMEGMRRAPAGDGSDEASAVALVLNSGK